MVYHNRVDPEAAQQFLDPDQSLSVLDGLDWARNPELSTSLESSILNGTSTGICFTTRVSGVGFFCLGDLSNKC